MIPLFFVSILPPYLLPTKKNVLLSNPLVLNSILPSSLILQDFIADLAGFEVCHGLVNNIKSFFQQLPVQYSEAAGSPGCFLPRRSRSGPFRIAVEQDLEDPFQVRCAVGFLDADAHGKAQVPGKCHDVRVLFLEFCSLAFRQGDIVLQQRLEFFGLVIVECCVPRRAGDGIGPQVNGCAGAGRQSMISVLAMKAPRVREAPMDCP